MAKVFLSHPSLENDPYMKAAVEAIVKYFKPIEGYLFGSQARGQAGPNSDYDFLIVVKRQVERERRSKFHTVRRKAGLTKAIDVVAFTKKGFESRLAVKGSLPATVRDEGTLLYAAA